MQIGTKTRFGIIPGPSYNSTAQWPLVNIYVVALSEIFGGLFPNRSFEGLSDMKGNYYLQFLLVDGP